MACIVPYYIYIIIFKDSYQGDPKETSNITQIFWITEFIPTISTSNKKYLTFIFRRIFPYYIDIIIIRSYSWVKCSSPCTVLLNLIILLSLILPPSVLFLKNTSLLPDVSSNHTTYKLLPDTDTCGRSECPTSLLKLISLLLRTRTVLDCAYAKPNGIIIVTLTRKYKITATITIDDVLIGR